MYHITHNKYNIPEDRLFCLGKRDNNPKRSFLFISKLLGKHLAVTPDVVKATGFMLASLKYGFENNEYLNCIKDGICPNYAKYALDDDVLVIGFCETATALGMSVAAAIEGSYYLCTTREPIIGVPELLTFEESHSHASTHHMFSNAISLNDFSRVILVDDEISTGKSLLHLMEQISAQSNNIQEFSILTILDWRNEEQKSKFAEFGEAHGVKVNVYSLVSGYLDIEENILVYYNAWNDNIDATCAVQNLCAFPRLSIGTNLGKIDYLTHTGLLGITYKDICSIEAYAQDAAIKISKDLGTSARSILVLGHGENIYIPSRVASALQSLGYETEFKTTSRTPIYKDGDIIRSIDRFVIANVEYHFYNKPNAENKDVVVMLSDTPFDIKLTNNIKIYNL